MDKFKCSCGAELRAYMPDSANTFGGESVLCYTEYDGIRVVDDTDMATAPLNTDRLDQFEQEWEQEFQEYGLYAANLNDVMDYGVHELPTFHDVYNTHGELVSYGCHTPKQRPQHRFGCIGVEVC